jgi:hypothetical protein
MFLELEQPIFTSLDFNPQPGGPLSGLCMLLIFLDMPLVATVRILQDIALEIQSFVSSS